eukprot:572216_1
MHLDIIKLVRECEYWAPAALVGACYYLQHQQTANALSVIGLGFLGSGFKGALILRNIEDRICNTFFWHQVPTASFLLSSGGALILHALHLYHKRANINGPLICLSGIIGGLMGVLCMGFVNAFRKHKCNLHRLPYDTGFEFWCLGGMLVGAQITTMHMESRKYG